MPGFFFHQLAAMSCPHGGVATIAVPAQQRVTVDGRPGVPGTFVATVADRIAIAGCVATPPCSTVQWSNVSGRVTAFGKPVLLQAPPSGPGNAVCVGPPAPAPVPQITTMQRRVTGM